MANTVVNGTPVYNFKVVLLGEGCVGKTSIVLRYIEDKFNPSHISTVQASFLTKKLNIDGKKVNLAIWDTAGQEKFHALGPIYYRSSNGAILVYDITDDDSFQKVKSWVKELRKILGTDISLVIVGNKTDLEQERNVALDDAETYATKVGAVHFETSAKLNTGIEDLFLSLTERMLTRASELEEQNEQLLRRNSQRRNVVVVDDDEIPSTDSNLSSTRHCCGNS